MSVSTFRLDKYEVTVGRFRKFVLAWDQGWRPTVGAGKHTHLNGGMGLLDRSGTSHEAGWNAEWTEFVDTSLEARGGEGAYATWTSTPGSNETRPINWVNWCEAYAFCIWDGGFLPSDLELDYAAAGGNAQNRFPWGDEEPGLDADLAIWGCYYNGTGTCGTAANIAPVGTAQGRGRYDQADLAGNLWELALDEYEASPPSDCSDCARFPRSSGVRVRKGGNFHYVMSALQASFRDAAGFSSRSRDVGFRCARVPPPSADGW